MNNTEKFLLSMVKYICVISATIVCWIGINQKQFTTGTPTKETEQQTNTQKHGNKMPQFSNEQEIAAMVNPEIVNIQVPLVRKCIKKIGIVRDEDGKLTCYAITLHEAMEIYYTKQDLKSPKGAQSSAPLEDITPIPNTPK